MRRDRHWLWLAMLLAAASSSSAQDEDQEQPYLPGLLATYRDAGGREFRRLDDAIAFDWQQKPPDLRLGKPPFTAQWRGLLWARGSGEYRLHVFATGEVEIRLAGKTILSKRELSQAWAAADPLELAFDRHALEVDFRQTGPAAGISLFWSGPQFSLEPISPRFLLHDRQATITSDFEHGRLLAAALRCVACHTNEEESDEAMPAPALTNLSGNLRSEWLTGWLMETRHDGPARRMPTFGMSRGDAEAIAAYLIPPVKAVPSLKSKSPTAKGKRNKTAEKKKGAKQEPPSAKQGERLFLTLGCLACHQWGELGESGLFGGGDLSAVADKRPTDFFTRWLADPVAVNRQHRMPIFELSDDERTSLALFLAQQTKPQKTADNNTPDAKLANRGRELIDKHRCGACHELPGTPVSPAKVESVKVDRRSDWSQSCAAAKSQSQTGLGYGLSGAQQRALEAYFEASPSRQDGDPSSEGAMLLVTQNCLACHTRDGMASVASALPAKLADKLTQVGQSHDELSPLIPTMTPPSLNSVGDKLHDEALAAAIRRTGPAYREYLLVRMPKFRLGDEELAAVTAHFVTADRIPPGAEAAGPKPAVEDSAIASAGGRLVSTDGFGCVSCHQIGSVVPDKAPLNARGPGLSQIDKRLRRQWFDRFVADPSRIVPRMEMPSVRIAVKGVMGDKVDAQLAAVWHAINTPGFEPPEPNPVRVLRANGIAERKEPPIVINDVVKTGERTFVHPLVIGLRNRQNFLYDLSEGRLTAWWLGDTARQRTKGKSWHWEPGGPMVIAAEGKSPELSILRGGKRLVPLRRGQHVAVLRGYRVRDGQVEISYLLQMGIADDSASPTMNLHVHEVWRSESAAVGASVQREVSATWSAADGDRLRLDLVPPIVAKDSAVGTVQRELRLKSGVIQIAGDAADWSLAADGVATSLSVGAGARSAAIQLTYDPLIPADTIDSPPLSFSSEIEAIEIAPGFAGRRLPLPGDIMPTAVAWRKDLASPTNHELVVGSLKGQVMAARDRDGDGLEDEASIVADGLATPYGIADGGEGLHVLTKAALLEVKDGGVQVLASGWGHTDDYHDWAVGLPRNEKGEYFIGLPCQQDERSAAAAKYRGAVLRLVPRRPSDDNPLHYDVRVVSTGHRFPMGMALNGEGALFVTDNQGNYNPFNELNHVRPGAFFGFINANEKNDGGFKSPPLAAPAIDIPHPWTRSVNGICFLDSPVTAPNSFGPLEGHLIGCEYDTRRLVRMSLQKVGDTYQGAAYPLSLEPSSPEKGFLGPIVCAVSPRGELYVGSIRDSGWGAGNNIGEVVQVKIEADKLPAGIAEMRAVPGGFEIGFFRAVDGAKAADAANYSLSSYRRESTPAYGGPDLDRRIDKVTAVEVANDRQRVTLKLAHLREGFVYELQVKNLTADGGLFHPAEAHFTLRRLP